MWHERSSSPPLAWGAHSFATGLPGKSQKQVISSQNKCQGSAHAPPTPTPSWQPGVPSPRKRMKDSGLRGNRSDQLLVRQRKRFLMFRLIIDQCRACLAAASCRPTLGPRCCGRWRSGGTPGVTVTPHHSPSCRRTAREPALGADAALVRQVRTAAAPGQCPVGGLAGVRGPSPLP